jgi:uncharacterized repeat protein (TIGR01451 family)
MTGLPRSSHTLDPRRIRRLVALVLSVMVAATIAPASLLGPSSAAAVGPVLSDTFSREDNWQIGASETGQPWEVWSGTAVVTGQTAAASVGGYTLAVADSGESDGVVSVTVPVATGEYWLVFRASNAGNYWRFGRSVDGAYELQQIAGWWFGSPAVTAHASPTPEDGDRLSCQLATTIVCSVDGAAVASSSDGFNDGATHVGFATASPSGPPPARFDDVTVETASAAADVSVTVASEASSVPGGAPVSWSVDVTNSGSLVAGSVWLTAPLPAGVTGTSATTDTGTCVVAASIACELGDLAPGATARVTISGTAPTQPGGTSLSVTTSTTSTDLDPGNDTASASVTIEVPIPAGAVVVDDFTRPDAWSMGSAPTGQAWEVWQGTARVASNQALASEPGYTLSVIDSGITSGTVGVSVPTIGSDYWVIARASNSGNYWRFGRAAGGGYELQQIRDWALGAPSVQVLGSVVPVPGDRLECRTGTGITCYVNGTAVAASADPFNATARHMGFAAYGVSAPVARFDALRIAPPVGAPDLVVGASSATPTVLAGEPMTWTATVRNAGALPAAGVELIAELPAGLGSVTSTPSTGSCLSGTPRRCALGDLAPGAQATVTYTAVAPTSIGGYTIAVQGTTLGDDGDPSTNRASATVGVRVLAAPSYTLTDTFSRPDAPTLGNASGGRPWEPWSGTMGIVSGRATKTSSAPGWAGAVIDPGFTYGTMQVRLAEGAAQGFQIVFRGRDTANHYRLTKDSSGFYRVEKVLNGRVIGLQFNAIRANVVPADGDLIRLVVRPDDGWFISINGVHVLDGGDVDLLGEYRFGLVAPSSAVRFDDVSISQVLSTGMTTTESFSHPNESVLELRTPTSGTRYVWLAPSGYWVSRSGSAVLDSPGFGLAHVETSSQRARVRVTVRSAANEAWLVFRYAEDGSHHRFGRDRGGRYRIQRIAPDGTTLTIPGGVTIHRNLRAGANDRLDVRQAADGTITAYVNGNLVATARDAVNGVQATAYGIAGDGGVVLDDLVINAP